MTSDAIRENKVNYQTPEIIDYGSIEATTQFGDIGSGDPFTVSSVIN
jgi:hypothetical protein